MQVARWGNSLAVRLPVELVRQLGLKEGDQVDLVPGAGQVEVRRAASAADVLNGLRGLRGRLEADQRLDRDAANGR